MNFPEFFKNIESSLKSIKSNDDLKKFQQEMSDEFLDFLIKVEEKVSSFL